jgi:hypothetical protein
MITGRRLTYLELRVALFPLVSPVSLEYGKNKKDAVKGMGDDD